MTKASNKTGNIQEIAKQHFEEVKNPKPRVRTGFFELDEYIKGIRYSDYVIVAGQTGQFKSTLTTNIYVNVVKEGIGAAFYNFEMSNLQSFRRILCTEVGLELDDIETGNYPPEVDKIIKDKINELSSKNVHLIDHGLETVEELVDDMAMKRRLGVEVFIVDYIQLLTSKNSGPRHEQVSTISRKLRNAARNMDAVIIGISSLRRSNKKDGSEHGLDDLMGSSSLEFDATQVFFIANKNNNDKSVYKTPYQESVLHLKKNRHGRAGVEASVLVFPGLYKFTNIYTPDNIPEEQRSDVRCVSQIGCNSSDITMDKNSFKCADCQHIYDKECGCSGGLVFYEKVYQNTNYVYAGLCAACGRGQAIRDAILVKNSTIDKDADKITILPFVFPKGYGKNVLAASGGSYDI